MSQTADASSGTNWVDLASGLLKQTTAAVLQDRQNKYELQKINAMNAVGMMQPSAQGQGVNMLGVGTGTLLLIGGAVIVAVLLMRD